MAHTSSNNHHIGVSPFGTVFKEGYSLDLGIDQAGIFSKSPRKTTQKGLKALANFAGIDKTSEKLALLFGTKPDSGRMGSDKNSRTLDFSLSDIKQVGISHPKQTEQKFDYWRVGWDGVNAATTFKFNKGQTLEFQMTIGGQPVSFFNSGCDYTVKVSVNIPNIETLDVCTELGDVCDPVDCREHTLALVKNLNEYWLPGGQVLSDYFDIYPIFSAPTANATPVAYTQWELEYCGFGGLNELSAVSAQYPEAKVERDTMTDKFVMVLPDGETPAPFVQTRASILKGCEDCPAGYDEIAEGVVYAVAIEDDGVTQVAKVQALPGAVADSAVKTGQDFGVGHYVVVLDNELTEAEEATFITANPTSIIKFVGAKSAFCADDTETTTAWVEGGTFNASQVTYRILVPDDCNGTRLAEIQSRYPGLTITQVGTSTNCVSVFQTTVETDPSDFKGCSQAIIQQMFNSEAPKPFGIGQYWFPYVVPGTPVATNCGFEIKAKPVVLSADECLIEELPFIMTSARIHSISGGYPVDYSMNTIVPVGTWRILQLERAQDLDNLGGNLRGWEQRGRFYFQDEKPYRKVIERQLTGTHSRLDNLTQYSDLFFTIEKSNKAGMNSKEYSYLTYHILVPYGRTTDLEAVYQSMAGAAGVSFEVK